MVPASPYFPRDSSEMDALPQSCTTVPRDSRILSARVKNALMNGIILLPDVSWAGKNNNELRNVICSLATILDEEFKIPVDVVICCVLFPIRVFGRFGKSYFIEAFNKVISNSEQLPSDFDAAVEEIRTQATVVQAGIKQFKVYLRFPIQTTPTFKDPHGSYTAAWVGLVDEYAKLELSSGYTLMVLDPASGAY